MCVIYSLLTWLVQCQWCISKVHWTVEYQEEQRDTCAQVTAGSEAFQACVSVCADIVSGLFTAWRYLDGRRYCCLWCLRQTSAFVRWFLWCSLSPAAWYIWACGKAYPTGSLFHDLSYDLEWNNSGKDLDCKTKCRARVVLSMNLYMCMLGALPSELFSNILFCHMRRYQLCVKWLTSSFSERSRCYFWICFCAKCLERHKERDGGVVWHLYRNSIISSH